MNRFLLRQFMAWSLAGLVLLGLILFIVQQGSGGMLWSLLLGGGWMVANCAVMAWMGAKVLRQSQVQPRRFLVGFVIAMGGSLALGGGLVLVFTPTLVGLAIGCSIPLVIFFVQVRRLQRTLNAHAR